MLKGMIQQQIQIRWVVEKYLGDIVTSSGGIRETVMDRRAKGYGKVGEILAILGEAHLGHHRVAMGLKLRDALLCNGMLYSSEAWSSIGDKEIKVFMKDF